MYISKKKSLIVLRWLLDYLSSPKRKKKERLPSFREIASFLGISIFPVKEAFDILIERGILESIPGSGCYIKNNSPEKLEEIRKFLESAYSEVRGHLGGPNLSKLRPPIIAVLISEKDTSFYGCMVEGISAGCREHCFWPLIFFTSGSVNKEEGDIQLLLGSKKIAGFIINPVIKIEFSAYFYDIMDKGIPLVFIGDNHFSSDIPYINVGCDNNAGMRQLMKYLYSTGHRKIVFVEHFSPISYAHEIRLSLYTRFMKEKKLYPISSFSFASSERKEAELIVKKFIDTYHNDYGEKPDAFVCFNDNTAFSLITILRQLNIRVPEDISVCGFDDRIGARYISPPLTTVKYPGEEIGYTAVKLLKQKFKGIIPLNCKQDILIKPNLIIRGSSSEKLSE